MGVTFMTPDEIVFVMGKVGRLDDGGFHLSDGTETLAISYQQVIKVYAVPD